MRFFCKRYFDWLFTAGLLFSALISVNRQYGFLPDFLEGALTGLAIVFLLLPGTLRHNKKLIRKWRSRRRMSGLPRSPVKPLKPLFTPFC